MEIFSKRLLILPSFGQFDYLAFERTRLSEPMQIAETLLMFSEDLEQMKGPKDQSLDFFVSVVRCQKHCKQHTAHVHICAVQLGAWRNMKLGTRNKQVTNPCMRGTH